MRMPNQKITMKNLCHFNKETIMTPEQWDLKRKYDAAFDKLFLQQDFKFYATSKLKRCPNGLNLNTDFDEETGEMIVVACCKIYGYEYSSTDHVCGDYYYGDKATEEMARVCLDYLKEKNPALYEEIKELDWYIR